MATRYYLAGGQSNMKGVGSGGAFSMPANLKVWNNHNNINTLANLGTSWVTPTLGAHPLNTGGANNLAVQAAALIAKANPDDQIRLVLVAMSSQSIVEWYDDPSGAGPMLDRTMAVLDAAGVTHLDGFWWQQGEADNAVDSATYLVNFNGIARAFRTAGLCTTSMPAIVGECAKKYTGSNANLAAVADSYSRWEIAKVAQFPTNSDTTHFTGGSLVDIGYVFAGLQMGLEA